jgi:hypothetical protein
MSFAIFFVVFLECIPQIECGLTNPQDHVILGAMPPVLGDTYRCTDVVSVVNKLRKQGKEKSLATLRGYLANGGDNARVLLICRLLFVNPDGWDRPILGETMPFIGKDDAKAFPLFPIALSDGVPFLLVRGYQLNGRPESAIKCLNLCDGFAMVKKDYPSAGYEKAARALIQTRSFRQCYDEEELSAMAEMVLRQAKKTEGSR